MIKTIFAENMKKARKKRGWSQEGASLAIKESGAEDFTRSRLGAIEEGRVRSVKYHVQKAIEKAYGVSNFERFMNDHKYFESPISGYELEKRYSALSPELKRVVDMLFGFL